MRVTLRDVAKQANVSPMTVTNVLRGRGSEVSETTRTRVMDAVREMDYVPVRVAMQNRQVATNVLGLVPYRAHLAGNEVDAGTYQGLCEGAYSHGYDLFVLLRRESEWQGIGQKARFLDRRTDGFVFVSPNVGEWGLVFAAMQKHTVPGVVCYRRDVPENIAWVDPDNETMMRLAVERLAGAGHRNIAYLRPPLANPQDKYRLANLALPENFDGLERIAYFERFARDYECAESVANVLDFLRPDWILDDTIVSAIRERHITAVIACGLLAATQLQAISRNAGMTLPRDLAVIALEEGAGAEVAAISTVAFDYAEVGRVAATVFDGVMKGREVAASHRIVPVRLRERGSVMPRS